MIRRPPRSTLFPTRRSSDLRRVAVARLHFGHQPAVVTHFGHRAADGGPVVVTKKQIRVHTLVATPPARSEEHTSELQSQSNLVCRLLLEKKKNTTHSRVRTA